MDGHGASGSPLRTYHVDFGDAEAASDSCDSDEDLPPLEAFEAATTPYSTTPPFFNRPLREAPPGGIPVI